MEAEEAAAAAQVWAEEMAAEPVEQVPVERAAAARVAVVVLDLVGEAAVEVEEVEDLGEEPEARELAVAVEDRALVAGAVLAVRAAQRVAARGSRRGNGCRRRRCCAAR